MNLFSLKEKKIIYNHHCRFKKIRSEGQKPIVITTLKKTKKFLANLGFEPESQGLEHCALTAAL